MNISREQAVELIKESNGTFFGVTFRKRTPPHEIRDMQARLNVKKYLKGGKPAYDFSAKNLIAVFDMRNGYRAIPIEGILELRINKEVYTII